MKYGRKFEALDDALKILAAATLTVTTTGAAFDFARGAAVGSDVYLNDKKGATVQAVVIVTSCDIASGDETYSCKIQTSPDNATWTDVSRIATIGTGTTTDGAMATGGQILLLFPASAQYVRVVVTIGGTTPSLVLGGVWIDPLVDAFV